MRLQTPSGNILGGVTYRLVVAGTESRGVVPVSGLIREEVAVDARDGTLFLNASEIDPQLDGELEFPFQLGALEPAETDRGVRARLQNLGYYHGAVDDPNALDATKRAMCEFRTFAKLPALADPLSEQAREDLLFVHGS